MLSIHGEGPEMLQDLTNKIRLFLSSKKRIDEKYEEELREQMERSRLFHQELKQREKESTERLLQLEIQLKANCDNLKNIKNQK